MARFQHMSELPSGVVTFLFTDIEGSTRLVKHFRDRYEEVLADHQRLLRAAFAAHSGHEVDTQGDSFFVAFSSARDALMAAIDGQLALLSYPWPDGVQVKVRMGLHTGQARATDGRYTGLAVHRAARTGAAGHGGQILVSQATQTLLEDEEEAPHVSLRDLGEHRLKDLDRPVRLYQACAEGLPESFPPPRGEAPLPDAAEAALAPALWRRTPILAAAGLMLLAFVAAAALIATRDSAGGLSGVQPNHIGVIDPKTSEIVDEIQVGVRPGPVAVGGGYVWVGNREDHTLTKIHPGRRTSLATIPLGKRTPTGIDFGEGYVWVAHGALGDMSRVDPTFESPRRFDVAPQPVGSVNGAVTVGLGAVWAVYGDSTLARIDPTTTFVTGRGLAGTNPAGVAVEGAYVWVLNTDDSQVQRFRPDTFQEGPLGTPTTVGERPTAIAAGEGKLWVANTDGDSVTRVDPSTPANAREVPNVGDGPAAIAVGERAVWVANGGDGTISRIDPVTLEVVKRIDVGNAPSGIAVGEGFVWVSVESR